jgi:hypothetical protein
MTLAEIGCVGKEGMETRRRAAAVIKRMLRTRKRQRRLLVGREPLEPYRCEVCGLWHIGSGSVGKGRRQSRRERMREATA